MSSDKPNFYGGTPIPPPPAPEDPSILEKQQKAVDAERKAKGRSSTVFTSPGAALPDANLFRRTLLGQ